MKPAFFGMALASVAAVTTANAQELVGSSLDLGYSGFFEQVPTPDGDRRPGQIYLGYSAEIGLTQQVTIQGDVAYHYYNAVSDDAFNLGLHAILHAGDAGAVGLFLGREEVFGLGVNYYGVEGGFETGTFSAEAYYSLVDDGAGDANLFGIAGDFDVGNGLALGIDYDRIDPDGIGSISRFAVTTRYEVQDGATVFAELGTLEADTGFLGLGTVSESFFGLGVEYTFGGTRGATFDRRGLSDLLPGL
jgi:hypothetical protein